MNRVSKYLILLIVSISWACLGCYQVSQEDRPNIIYVLADDLGYGDISAFAPEGKIKTTHIDRLAAEGMRFTDAHTSSSVCTPTRYGILTGRYNWRTRLKQGVLTGTSKALIPNSRKTVASLLKTNGYHTAFIGKWHLGWDWGLMNESSDLGSGWNESDFGNIDFTKPVQNNPNDLGFDYTYGHAGSLDMAPYVYVENGFVTQIPDSVTVNTGKYSWWREGPTSNDFIHDDVTPNFFRKAMGYVKGRSSTKQPFFLYLALPSPHTPILPTEPWQDKSGLNPYADFMLMIDDYMGQLAETIKSAGIEENTMVIFASDNGCSPAAKIDELIEKGHYPNHIYRGHKADIFEGGHRIPFIVKWPKMIKAGSVSEQTICTTDLFATCAAIIDYKIKDNEAEDSYNLLPVLTKNVKDDLRPATVHHSINGSFAIRKGPWKLIMCPDSGGWSYPTPKEAEKMPELPQVQLYNLNSDPKEEVNLYESESEKVAELKSLLIQYIEDGRSTPGSLQKNDTVDDEWAQIKFSSL